MYRFPELQTICDSPDFLPGTHKMERKERTGPPCSGTFMFKGMYVLIQRETHTKYKNTNKKKKNVGLLDGSRPAWSIE